MNFTDSQARSLQRFAHHAGRGIHRFNMIGPGDRVLIGVSGGKDSLALSLALVERKKWVPIDYELFAVHIEWREHPLEESEKRSLDDFYAELGVPLHRITASICPPTFRKKFSCYTCSRNRKRLLFDEAERIGATRIALGHHLDDIARTTLMNLLFHGEFSTMMPVQEFFGGKVSIIRPLCEVREEEIRRVSSKLDLPVLSARCPNAQKNQRSLMKELLRQASRVDRHATTNVYGAAWRIKHDYLPVSIPQQPLPVAVPRGAGGE